MDIDKGKGLSLEVVITGESSHELAAAYGWGDGAENHRLKGEVREITLFKDGLAVYSFRIDQKGSLHISSYAGSLHMTVPQNLLLENNRPWEEN